MVAHSRTPLRPDRLRALNLPAPVVVITDGDDGLPTGVVEERSESAEGRKGGRAERKNGAATYRRTAVPPGGDGMGGGSARAVAEVIEVWRVDDEWWRTPINRRYVEVILEGGKHVMLFEDLVTNVWFVQMP